MFAISKDPFQSDVIDLTDRTKCIRVLDSPSKLPTITFEAYKFQLGILAKNKLRLNNLQHAYTFMKELGLSAPDVEIVEVRYDITKDTCPAIRTAIVNNGTSLSIICKSRGWGMTKMLSTYPDQSSTINLMYWLDYLFWNVERSMDFIYQDDTGKISFEFDGAMFRPVNQEDMLENPEDIFLHSTVNPTTLFKTVNWGSKAFEAMPDITEQVKRRFMMMQHHYSEKRR